MPNENLHQKLKDSFRELKIPKATREKFMPYLDILEQKDIPTWEHSVRVGLLGRDIANYIHEDPHALFLPGIVHDCGKALIDSTTLKKIVGFNKEDKKQMDDHPIYSYKLLEGVAPFSALVSYYHHYFGDHGYPRKNKLPPVNISFSEDTLHWAKECGRLVAIADFWDAVTHRANDKYSPGNPRLPTPEEAFKILLNNSGSRKYLVNRLYENKILK
jgi:HD-GYP domain-containing protein (c-di-GMP phosphodiesterase class II)